MIIRAILPDWAKQENPSLKKVQEGDYDNEKIENLNYLYYNIYFLPNYPSLYDPGKTVDGTAIDVFDYVFVDMDLKDGFYTSKEQFIALLENFSLKPTRIVDSGNGIHAYWKISDLNGKNYLRLQRRLLRLFHTDESVATIYQLMRLPGTVNTKKKDDLKLCTIISDYIGLVYSCEQLDRVLPKITEEDENYCNNHYDLTYKQETTSKTIIDEIPEKFLKLVRSNNEIKKLWSGDTQDRSVSDFRMAHIMFASGFTKDECLSVLVNSGKALERSPRHRISYASNIVDKIWVYENSVEKEGLNLSNSVKDILSKGLNVLKGTRFPCWQYIDATHHGFRLGQVIGLVAGSGVGKTAMALNMFAGFVENNPEYEHFFVPLEQPVNEIADRWKTMCGDKTHLYEKVHVISNYADDGSFRHLSFDDIKEYLIKFQKVTGKKVGCVVIDHIGALKKKGKDGENQDLMTICHEMKAFAIQTNTMLIMQSQSSREKAGIGDLELNKDAAYGTVYFESYCDYLITIWQPLKRCYGDKECPTITSFKFCKIRHKNRDEDSIQEDVSYCLNFDTKTEFLSPLTQDERNKMKFWVIKATNLRSRDRKTDVVEYNSMPWVKNDGT